MTERLAARRRAVRRRRARCATSGSSAARSSRPASASTSCASRSDDDWEVCAERMTTSPGFAGEHRGIAPRGRGQGVWSRRGARRSRARSRRQRGAARRRTPVLPGAGRATSRRHEPRRGRPRSRPRATPARRVPPRRVRTRGRSTRSRRPRALHVVGASTSTASSSISTRRTRGVGTSCTASRTRCAASASASFPARSIDEVDRAPRRRRQPRHRRRRRVPPVEPGADRPDDLRPFERHPLRHRAHRCCTCEAMIAPPGGAAAMYYTGADRGLLPPRPHLVPDDGTRPASRCGRKSAPVTTRRFRAITSRSRRSCTSPTSCRGSSDCSDSCRVTARDGRCTPNDSWASSVTSRIPRSRWGCSRRRRCARCGSSSTSACISNSRSSTAKPHAGETWTPELALPFVIGRSRFPEVFMRSEVDRYLGWPGQAISYKVGERVWLECRADAKQRKGAAFDLKEFHTYALDLGSMGLGPLRRSSPGSSLPRMTSPAPTGSTRSRRPTFTYDGDDPDGVSRRLRSRSRRDERDAGHHAERRRRSRSDVVDAGFTVAMPQMFGEPGKEASRPLRAEVADTGLRVQRVLQLGAQPHVADHRLAARARHAISHEQCGGPGVGAIGMCFTGGFALAMAVDDTMLAPVLSQPSLPFAGGKARKRALGLSDADLATVAAREDLCVHGDALHRRPGSSRRAIRTSARGLRRSPDRDRDRQQQGRTRTTSRGLAHSVVTEHLVDEPGHPTREALDRVLAFFHERLSP